MSAAEAPTTRWQAALGWAMVGEELVLLEPGRPDPEALLADLAAAGWTPARIADHARRQEAAEVRWPHQIPAGLRAGCGAAQLHAAVARTRVLLGLVAFESRVPTRTVLNADEQRLLRDVPPHHGS